MTLEELQAEKVGLERRLAEAAQKELTLFQRRTGLHIIDSISVDLLKASRLGQPDWTLIGAVRVNINL